jgi:crotonobetainyl-CoA:carnitine CoA-transferase CaiB-like acyl-CoA transferase
MNSAALAGLKVVEFAHVIAGPLAGTLLADLGADVVHVDDPAQGDPGRKMGPPKGDTYLWWKVAARNKRSVTIDLRTPDGQDLARSLVRWADVVITNFRVKTLERWGLDWEGVHAANPKAIYLQVTGFGARTTLRNTPGFGKVGEARSGVVYVTGFPDGPPVHTGFSHADTVTALMGAYAITAALHRRDTDPEFDGEWIDLALFETLFRLIEWQVIFYDQLGQVPERAGNQLAVSPAAVINTYQSADGHWLTVTSGTPRSVHNVAALVGVPHGDVATVELQAANKDRLDRLLREWIGTRTATEALAEMETLEVVASRIFSIADIVADPTYAELGDIITVDDADLGSVRMQGVIPRLTNHPGRVWRTGPGLGEDNEIVFGDYLGIDAVELQRLRDIGAIAVPARETTEPGDPGAGTPAAAVDESRLDRARREGAA